MITETVKRNSGYVEVTYRSLRQGTFLGALCRSVIESFGRSEEGCRWGYAAFREKLRISRATVWRKTKKQLKDDDAFEIGRIGEKSGQIRYRKELKKETHITVLNWFRTDKFLFVYKDKKGEIVKTTEGRLNNVEVALLSFIYTHRNDEKNCEGTYTEFAGILHTTPESICRAVKRLRAADLIKRIRKGWNGGKNRFTINYAKNSVFRYAENSHRKKTKDNSTAEKVMDAPQKEGKDASIPVSYYKELAKERKAKAEKYMMQVYEQVPSFAKIQTKLEATEKELKTALKSNPLLFYTLTKKKKLLLAQRDELASKMNINLERFKPEYYGKKQCSLCCGTGKLPQGTYCKCYTHRWRQM